MKQVNPIQDGAAGGKKPPPPTSFFPVTSTNVGTSPKRFLTFNFSPFKAITSVSPKLLKLNQNFSHRNARFTKL